MQEGGDGSGSWSAALGWDRASAWAQQQWEEWREAPQQWAESARAAAHDWRQALSWQEGRQRFEGWQERHWRVFEERQKARLAAATEEQRARWRAWEERKRARLGELSEEGQQLVRREIGAFERW